MTIVRPGEFVYVPGTVSTTDAGAGNLAMQTTHTTSPNTANGKAGGVKMAAPKIIVIWWAGWRDWRRSIKIARWRERRSVFDCAGEAFALGVRAGRD